MPRKVRREASGAALAAAVAVILSLPKPRPVRISSSPASITPLGSGFASVLSTNTSQPSPQLAPSQLGGVLLGLAVLQIVTAAWRLIASERASSGHRRYPRSVLRRVAFIVFAQRIGLTLEEIGAELARLPTDRIPKRRDWARLSGAWTARIDARIAELERLRAGLTECIGCGCLSIERCRLANPADHAGAAGPGPRFWIG